MYLRIQAILLFIIKFFITNFLKIIFTRNIKCFTVFNFIYSSNYIIISSSALCGKYDVQIKEDRALEIGLTKESVIKTTKIYTGSKTKLGKKISDLPQEI